MYSSKAYLSTSLEKVQDQRVKKYCNLAFLISKLKHRQNRLNS